MWSNRDIWWRDVCSLMDNFRAVTSCVPGDGGSIFCWKDRWMENILARRMPRLYSFALNLVVSLKEVFAASMIEDLAHFFAIPVSPWAFQELHDLHTRLMDLYTDAQLGSDLDAWSFSGSHSGKFPPSGYYQLMFSCIQVCSLFGLIWKSKSLPKQKVFMWLLLLDHLSTRDMMDRLNWIVDSGVNCALCQNNPRETREHLFFN